MRLYHNPRCSKSRMAVKLLNDKGVEFEEYRYLDNGIKDDDLTLLASLRGIIRKQEKEFKQLNFPINSSADIIKALRMKPKLLERPVLVKDGKAVIGRPPEEILTIID